MKNFDPLKTQAENGRKSPSWLFSLSKQRALLATRSLKEITVGDWMTTVKIIEKNEEPAIPYDPGKDPTQGRDEVTERERKKFMEHIEAMINKDLNKVIVRRVK